MERYERGKKTSAASSFFWEDIYASAHSRSGVANTHEKNLLEHSAMTSLCDQDFCTEALRRKEKTSFINSWWRWKRRLSECVQVVTLARRVIKGPRKGWLRKTGKSKNCETCERPRTLRGAASKSLLRHEIAALSRRLFATIYFLTISRVMENFSLISLQRTPLHNIVCFLFFLAFIHADDCWYTSFYICNKEEMRITTKQKGSENILLHFFMSRFLFVSGWRWWWTCIYTSDYELFSLLFSCRLFTKKHFLKTLYLRKTGLYLMEK